MNEQRPSSNQKVISNSIIYTISGLLMKCFSFFLLPLYTAYLTTDGYGLISIANSFLTTMSFIVAFSLYSAVMRFYVDLRSDKEKLKRFYGSIIIFVWLSSILFIAVLSAFRGALSQYVFSGVDFYPVIVVCLASLVFNCQHTIYENILRSQQKALKCSVLSLSYFFVTVILNIVLVVFCGLGAVGVLLATLCAGFLYTSYFVADMIIKGEIKFCLDVPLLKEALKYSIPIMPHNLATHIAQLISKMLIGGTVSLASLGVYSVATQFSLIADTVQTYINNAYSPWLFEKLNRSESEKKESIRSVVNMLCSVTGILFVGISLFAQDYIILFVNKDFLGAWRYVPLAVLVYAIKTIYYFYVSVLFYYKKASKKLFVATITSSLINILLSAALIPSLGAYGSILADAIAMLVRVVIIVIMGKQYEDTGLRVIDFIKNFLVISAFTFGGLALSYLKYPATFSLINLGYKLLILFIYMAFVFLNHKREIMRYMQMLFARRKKATDKANHAEKTDI